MPTDLLEVGDQEGHQEVGHHQKRDFGAANIDDASFRTRRASSDWALRPVMT
jgi:hypothetical protein